jgi:hypothetical protein
VPAVTAVSDADVAATTSTADVAGNELGVGLITDDVTYIRSLPAAELDALLGDLFKDARSHRWVTVRSPDHFPGRG